METSTQKPRLPPQKRALIAIAIIITNVVIVLSFINPFFSFDDIIYYAILGGILVPLLLPLRGCGGSGMPFMMARSKHCMGCGGPLPLSFKPGNYCPHCGAYIAGERTQRFGSRACSWDDGYAYGTPPAYKPSRSNRRKSNRPPVWKDSVGNVKENYLVKKFNEDYANRYPTGYEISRDSNFKSPGDTLVPARERRTSNLFKDSENNPENSPFKPPFEALFKDQESIKDMFSRFLNWAAVGISLRRWVKSVQNNPQSCAETGMGDGMHSSVIRSDVEIDAVAKLEAWKIFERQGFHDPAILPRLYREQRSKQEEADRLVIGMKKLAP